ncbi:Flagellar motility protein MotE (MotC chaperone) OS=Ureibacillus acetophenoni OX=614649 GN=SAMN05877842_101473 PE=4 SV=1 [Ureibacillus acetophenoni]
MARTNFENENIDTKSPSLFQKFFYWVLIPLVFVIAVLLVIASFTGTNVFEKAKELSNNLPFVSSQEADPDSTPIDGQKLVELQAEIEEKEAEIAQLQSQLESANAKNQEAQVLQEELEYEIQKLKNQQSAAQQKFTELVSAYEKMSAKEAAPILEAMNTNEAVRILSNLKPATLSEVLSKMKAENAAKFTELLAQ